MLLNKGKETPLQAMMTIFRQDGLRGLQKGLLPAYGYQILLNGTRLGLYEKLANSIQKNMDVITQNPGSLSGLSKMMSGALSGVLGAFVASPLFLVKTRMQSFTEGAKAFGTQHSDVKKGTLFVLKKVYQTEGMRGLWAFKILTLGTNKYNARYYISLSKRGSDASMMRTGVGSAVQLSSYDFFKTSLLNSGLFYVNEGNGGVEVHFSASLITSFFVCLFMNPLDVASTRMYNQPSNPDGSGKLYKNGIDCLVKTARVEGFNALYKGFSTHYLRIGPHTILTFVLLEQLKILVQ